MNVAASTDPRIQKLRVTKDQIIAELVDGRVISVPLAWSWRLSVATAAPRANLRLIGAGQGVYWPDVDEDISAESLLYGTPAPKPRSHASAGKTSGEVVPHKRRQPTRPTRASRG